MNDVSPYKLKLFIWLMTGAFTLYCVVLWLALNSAHHFWMDRELTGEDVAGFTRWVLGLRHCVLGIPLPWWIALVRLSSRPVVRVEDSLLFVATMAVAATIMLLLTVAALGLPFLILAEKVIRH